jgi:hypothetical protein
MISSSPHLQATLKGKVSLVLANVPWDLLVPFVLTSPTKIPVYNRLVEDYVVFVFYFVDKFLTTNGAILFFHPNDLCVLKEMKSYLESYSFQIRVKWAIVNSLPLISLKDPSMKVLIQIFPPSLVSKFLHVPLFIILSFEMIQTLMIWVILLVKDLGESNSQLNSFVFSPSFEDLLQKGGQCSE